MRIRFPFHFCFAFLFCAFAASNLCATPANKKALEKYFGPALPAALNHCGVCHVKKDGHGAASLKEFPHNPFGKSIAKLDGDIASRLDAVSEKDADGDGLSNLKEILMGESPGTPGNSISNISKTQTNQLVVKLAAFEKHRNRYQWRPFQTVSRPAVPEIKNRKWPMNPIDHFIVAKHEEHNLQPRPEAPREIWLRRVSIDLTGLAPLPDEIESFLNDPSDSAHEKVVDRLLASPRYGERWGRHWMDVWRYSDWAGYRAALRESARHIWNWRDWIVEALNQDTGYDEMIRQMFAADELYPDDESKLRATGYLARNYHRSRDQWMDDVVTHTSQAFLGITMGCSKCHDHMYDPFPQTDYYAMRAVFESYQVRTDRVPGQLDIMKNGLPRAYDSNIDAKTWLFDKGDERFPIKENPVAPGVPASLGGSEFFPSEIKLPVKAYRPWRREFVRKDLLGVEDAALAKATAALEKLGQDADPLRRKELELKVESSRLAREALLASFAVETMIDGGRKDSQEWKQAAQKTFDAQRKATLAKAKWQIAAGEVSRANAEKTMATAKAKKDKSKQSAAAKVMTKAKKDLAAAKKSLAAAEKRMKGAVTTKYKARQGDYPNRSSGRRAAFAKWLVDRKNPLTARVAMNQIWMRHFEHGIVPTVNDLGNNGREPSHPALLDWLAAELMARNWSMKQMHRMIVLSATYRQCGTPDPNNITKDPDNRFLWRMPSRRMEGEVVRDNLLWVSGRLDESMGGPDIDHKLAQKSQRRSIYLRHAHEKLVDFIQIFDGPKVTECYLRHESVQPHQALALHNSPLTKLAAEKLSADLAASNDPVSDIFVRLLGRKPTPEERRACEEFLTTGKSDPERMRERLVTVVLNHNDFVVVR